MDRVNTASTQLKHDEIAGDVALVRNDENHGKPGCLMGKRAIIVVLDG